MPKLYVRKPTKRIDKPEEICLECGKSVKILNAHMKKVHDYESQMCSKCGKDFKNIALLKHHITNVHEKIPCVECGRSIGISRMSSHRKFHEKSYTCDICSKRFGQSQALREHINVHNGKKPYMCKYCPDGFASFGNLRMHEKRHEGYRRKKSKKLCSIKSE